MRIIFLFSCRFNFFTWDRWRWWGFCCCRSWWLWLLRVSLLSLQLFRTTVMVMMVVVTVFVRHIGSRFLSAQWFFSELKYTLKLKILLTNQDCHSPIWRYDEERHMNTSNYYQCNTFRIKYTPINNNSVDHFGARITSLYNHEVYSYNKCFLRLIYSNTIDIYSRYN